MSTQTALFQNGTSIELTAEQARAGYHSGPCDDDIAVLRKVPEIARQLEAIAPHEAYAELRPYGAWDDVELADHDANLSRLLWLACADVVETEGLES